MTETMALTRATKAMGAAMPRMLSRRKATVEGALPPGSKASVGRMSIAMPVKDSSNCSIGTLIWPLEGSLR